MCCVGVVHLGALLSTAGNFRFYRVAYGLPLMIGRATGQ